MSFTVPDGRVKHFLKDGSGPNANAIYIMLGEGRNTKYHPYILIPVINHINFQYYKPTELIFDGQLIENGGDNVTEMGYVYSKNPNPIPDTQGTTKLTIPPTFSTFQVDVDNLDLDTWYHFRPFAKNRVGVAYGDENSQLIMTYAVVNTGVVTNITSTSAEFNGNVTFDGRGTVSSRGFTFQGGDIPVGSGTGTFFYNKTGLDRNTQYSVNTYAVNEAGTVYGSSVSFWTLIEPPSVTTNSATDVQVSSALLHGNVTDDGGINPFTGVVNRGFVYSYRTTNPEIGGSDVDQISSGTGTESFSSEVINLEYNTTYYFRAYAINSQGTQGYTSYGDILTLTTPTTTTTTREP
jgi:hypothetical protein